MPRALLLAVGTGDINRPEESLLTPLRKSIDQGEWSRTVLLPSQITDAHALIWRETKAEYSTGAVPSFGRKGPRRGRNRRRAAQCNAQPLRQVPLKQRVFPALRSPERSSEL
jgi:hypothetical protein